MPSSLSWTMLVWTHHVDPIASGDQLSRPWGPPCSLPDDRYSLQATFELFNSPKTCNSTWHDSPICLRHQPRKLNPRIPWLSSKQASSDSARPNRLHPSHGEGNSWPHCSWSLSPCSLFLHRRSREQSSISCLVHEMQTSFRSHGVKTQIMTMCRRPSTKGRHQLIW